MRQFFLFIYSFVIAITLLGCATSRSSTSSERIRTEYIHQRDTLLRHDSTYVHDSIFVTVHGDTILQYKFRTEYRDRIQYRTHNDTVNHTDTLVTTVVKTVEHKQTIFQRVTEALGSLVIFLAIALGVLLLVRHFSPK